MSFIDNLLDRITMYRLVLYVLIGYLSFAEILTFFGVLPFSPLAIAVSTSLILIVSYIVHKVFYFVFKVPVNNESFLITALILASIVKPFGTIHDLAPLGWVAVWGVASKYIFAIKKKHIFNPAAISVFLVAVFLGRSAPWWMGTTWMMPVVLLGGLLLVKKLQREDMILSFVFGALAITLGQTFLNRGNLLLSIYTLIFQSSLLFFAFIMLTEPLTSPTRKKMQIIYGGFVGILFSPQFHLASLSFTPEQALLIGNIFAYLVNPKQKLLLYLKEKITIGKDTMDFVFSAPEKLVFTPGQYMEWTMPQDHTDSRGNRRYFTFSSSPTEDNVRIGVKFYENGSSYKRTLANLALDSQIFSGQLAGDFVLPKDPSKKLVFVAGGIGITPFRSILKFLLDTNQKRDIVVIYSNKTEDEIVYKDVLSDAQVKLGIKTIYTLTDMESIPTTWQGKKGRVSPELIQEEIKDFKERTYYLSGPHAMVSHFEEALHSMQIPKKQIVIDFFPGYA